jgi:pimeloyl-[acyl-carrier protein] methyl ester esterase
MKTIRKQVNKKHSLVILPGWGFSSNLWNSVFPTLNVNIYCLDFPVQEKPISEKSWKEIEQTLLFQIPKGAYVMGWSLGGLIAMSLVEKYSAHFKGLILVSTNPKFISSESWPGIDFVKATAFYKNLEENVQVATHIFLQWIQYPSICPSIRKNLRDHFMDQRGLKSFLFYLDLLFHLDLRECYSFLKGPILHILGDQDPLVPKDLKVFLKASNPLVCFRHIHSAGHVPFFTHSQLFKENILEFLNS